MLDNLTDKHAVLDKSPHLFRQWDLLSIVLLGLGRHDDINASTLAGEDFGVETLLSKIDGSTVDLVKQDGWEGLLNLQGEVGALDDVDGGDQAVDDKIGARAVVDANGIRLALEDDGGLVAAGDEDGLAE